MKENTIFCSRDLGMQDKLQVNINKTKTSAEQQLSTRTRKSVEKANNKKGLYIKIRSCSSND